MTDNEAMEKAKATLRAEHAAYMREWRKRNPDKVKASSERAKKNKLNKLCAEVLKNG